ncbi:MAG: UDP-N-acetylmuramoyl-L-alanyl-D-glutamate--2,6-diaminopimelate ligase [Motiliproteus sp.]|jgi:UDP-N-acetylmuramoyl-L-alanyl-D-glutamate--2,6-diaminopimelate ligase
MTPDYTMTLQALFPNSNLPPGSALQQVTGISNDSRRIQGGDLFLACPGGSQGPNNQDGGRYIEAAIASGAVAIACEEGSGTGFGSDPCSSKESGARALTVPVIEVKDIARRQAELASRFYRQPSQALQMIGITGTNGKTSCSHFIAQALTGLGRKTALIGTTGNGFAGALETTTHTTPNAVRLQQLLARFRDQGAEAVAMEASSHALDQQRVAEIAFDLAVFTNLSRDHLDYHGSMETYAEVKARLFLDTGITQAVINTDDAFGRQLLQRLPASVDAIAIGEQLQPGTRQLQILRSRLHSGGIEATIASPWGELQISTALLGYFNLYNLLSALGVLLLGGVESGAAVAVLNQLEGVEGRMQAFKKDNKPLLVVDYAHTPDALDKALASLREHCDGQLWCLFGCGGDRDRGKRPLMAQVAELRADRLVISSDNPRSEEPEAIIDELMAGLKWPARALRQADRRLAIETVIAQAAPGDVVLIAGKGHEAYQEIKGVRYPCSDIEIVRGCLGAVDAVY